MTAEALNYPLQRFTLRIPRAGDHASQRAKQRDWRIVESPPSRRSLRGPLRGAYRMREARAFLANYEPASHFCRVVVEPPLNMRG